MDGYVQQHIASYRCRFNGTRRGALIARDNSIRWGGWSFYFDLPQSVSLRRTAEPDAMGTRVKSQMETPGADGEFDRVGRETKHTRWSGDEIQPKESAKADVSRSGRVFPIAERVGMRLAPCEMVAWARASREPPPRTQNHLFVIELGV